MKALGEAARLTKKQSPNIFLPFPKSSWYPASQLFDNRIAHRKRARYPTIRSPSVAFNVASGRSPVGLMSVPCRFHVGLGSVRKTHFQAQPTNQKPLASIFPKTKPNNSFCPNPRHPENPEKGRSTTDNADGTDEFNFLSV